jgi:FAD/FMN-containing dehydrogenase/Fe-S oxidoreductase
VSTAELTVRSLEDDLAEAVEGEVRFGDGDRALYATDGSNYRQVPIGVVVPRSVDDAVAAVAVCRDHDAPVLSRGGGTSLAGQCCNAAVVIDWSKYLRQVVELDPAERVARVRPGCVLDDLRDQAERHHLTFGPDPATHDHCTLGGMIGNNSCGIHSVMAGRTSDNVRSLDILTYDGLRMTVGPTPDDELESIIGAGGRRGEIYAGLKRLRDTYADEIRDRYPQIPRRVSGYNLDELLPENGFDVARALVGTEGTCVTVLEAELQLIPSPPSRSLLVLGYPDIYAAADHIEEVMAHGPCGCEGIDSRLFDLTREKGLHPHAVSLMPDGDAWLFVELGGEDKEESDGKAHELMSALGKDDTAPSMKLFDDPPAEHQVWQVRESGLASTAHESGGKDTWPGWEDSAVPIEHEAEYLRGLRKLYDRYGYDAALYGHFGQGCIHTRIDFGLRSASGIERFRDFMDEASDLVLSYGGSLSGEHGDGQARAELLPKMYGDRLVGAFREFKALWDPAGRMNPGKVVDPNPIDGQLRLGTDYAPWEPVTFFRYPDDEFSFERAAGLKCVGVGNCRREGGGTMCPSYMVTHEEKDSTRGRARMLFEMLQGDVVVDGWRSEAVREALDLCLACKGCLGDCPVNVDMATYKAEFLAHHYARRLRPAAHYSMGWLPMVSRAASKAPRLVNAVAHARGLEPLLKKAGGIDPARTIPRFATRTLRQQLKGRPQGDGRRVLLWADTFTNHFDPQIGMAAVEVLEHAGYAPVVLDQPLCCGLTWISTGQLKTATRVLRRTVDALAPELRDGTLMVGLEPSCTATFRHDLTELFPHDQDAQRIAEQTRTLAELLDDDPGWEPPSLDATAIVQGHCHHKAVMHLDADESVYAKVGLDAEVLDSGCCGLAGNFGFEAGHHDVSIACAERVLLPAVRETDPDTLVMADGFSCRTQIAQNSDREPVHLAQVLARALGATPEHGR